MTHTSLAASDSEHDLRAVLDGLSDALVVVDLDRRVHQANAAAHTWAGAADDLVGRSCHTVFGCDLPDGSPERECPLPLVLASGATVKLTHRERAEHGGVRYVDVIASPLRAAGGAITGVIESRRDATAERQLEDLLVHRHEQLSILNAIARTVSQSLDLGDILDQALDEVLRLTGVDIGAIFLRADTLGKLELLSYRGLSAEAARDVAQFGMLDGSCGGVLEHGELVVVPDLACFRGRRASTLQRERLRTLVHVPLTAKGFVLGSMCVGTRRLHEFDATEQELLTAIGSQIAVAIENARLYAEIQQREHLRGELLRKLISAQEEERKRIARELHDDASQTLTALIYAAEEAADLTDPAEVRALLDDMRSLARHTLDGVHKLIFDLRPSMLDHLGLIPALRWLAQSRLEPAGVRVTISERCPGGDHLVPCRLPPEMEIALFRAVQEAIANIARHAAARNVRLDFDRDDRGITIRIQDDGVGFDALALALAPDSGRGLGLLGMRERVELLGGAVELDAAPGAGTRLTIWAPTPR